jgi:hypothetical protein
MRYIRPNNPSFQGNLGHLILSPFPTAAAAPDISGHMARLARISLPGLSVY